MNTELSEEDLLRLSLVSDDKTLELLGYMMYNKTQKEKIKRETEMKINEEKIKKQLVEEEQERLYKEMEENEKKIDSIYIPDAEITNIRS